MSMTKPVAENVARTLRLALDEGRWSPDWQQRLVLLDLERALPISIQAGQPELEAMQARLIARPALELLVIGTRAMSQGGFASPSPSDVALFGRPPAPRLAASCDLPLLDGLSRAA